MYKKLILTWLIVLSLIFIAYLSNNIVRAQSATALTILGGAVHTTCLTPAAGQYTLCVATDGIWVSNNGAAYFQVVAPAAAAGVQKVNGVAPGATGNVTVSCVVPTNTVVIPAATATVTVTGTTVSSATTLGSLSTPLVSAAVPSISASVPSVTDSCTAAGS